MPRSNRTDLNLPSLTGLRFAAAFGVWLSHAAFLDPGPWGRALPLLIALGPAGVSLFFVLSGFVLTRSARPGETAPAFWRRRAVKVYPAHLTAWAAVTSLTVAAGLTGAFVMTDFLPGILLVQTWLPDPRYLMAGNIISWSLCCEVFFYLLFPLLLPLVRRVPDRRLTAATLLAVAAVWLCPVLSYAFDGPRLPGFPLALPARQVWFAYFFPPARLPEFVLGMLLAARLRSPTVPAPRMGVRAAAALLLGSLAAGTLLLPPAFSFAAAGIIPTALLIRSTAGSDLRRAPSLLRTRPMILLGEISYCFYLTHACVLLALHQSLRLLGRERFGPSVTCFGLAASVAVAWLLHIGVERPCMRRFAEPGRVRRRRLAQAARSG